MPKIRAWAVLLTALYALTLGAAAARPDSMIQSQASRPGPDYRSPREAAWWCIEGHESSHNPRAMSPHGTYAGPLQFDRDFERRYGPEFLRRFHGRANVWPRWATRVAADRGYRERGYAPWPRTARACGLPV
jgi:hypothetical protein